MTEPQCQQFGLSPRDAERIQRRLTLIASGESGIHWMDSLIPAELGCAGELIGAVLSWTVLWPFFLLGLMRLEMSP